ncbi:DUF4391 domain-containing protein [Segatella bryantii]|uniref:DUF4391 domain-containing protein n=1 Tax=Segatella bryantii TaxID=77095 RepID=UPI00242FA131|nr:DUF4391 domain-containing protein [Segatella bryantii]
MYGLPPNTLINKPLYKKAVFEKFNLKAAERDRFDADISCMALVARVSSATVPALTKGKEIEGFYVLQVALKRKDYDPKNILMLQKLIPQKLIFALQFEEQTQFCIFHTRLYQSGWMATDEAVISLQGLSLDGVWNNIVAIIGGLDTQSEKSIEEQIIQREQREKLLRQIESLERQCRTEKQTRKKYELHQQLMKLKEELK